MSEGALRFASRFDTKDGNSERKLRYGPRSSCQDTACGRSPAASIGAGLRTTKHLAVVMIRILGIGNEKICLIDRIATYFRTKKIYSGREEFA